MTSNGYKRGFSDGLVVTLTLLRAGCSAEDLATLLNEEDPALADPMAYQDLLAELRRELQTDGIVPDDGRLWRGCGSFWI